MVFSLFSAGLRGGGSMLHNGGIPSCWLAASAAQGYTQVLWQQVASMQRVTAAAPRPAVYNAHQQHVRSSMTSGAAPGRTLSPAKRAAVQAHCSLQQPRHMYDHKRSAAAGACAATSGFQLPGMRPTSSSSMHYHMPSRQLSTAPQHTGSSQAEPSAKRGPESAAAQQQAVASASAGLLGLQAGDGQRKRPAEMNTVERLLYLQERILDEYNWYLEELPDQQIHGASTTFRSTCPDCNNGSKQEDCFAVTVTTDDRDVQVPARPSGVVWCCHRATCGFTGGVSLYSKLSAGEPQQPLQGAGAVQRAQQQEQQQLQAQLRQLQQLQQRQAQAQPQVPAQPAQSIQQQQQQQQLLLQQHQHQQQQQTLAAAGARQWLPPLATAVGSQASGASAPRQLGRGFKPLSPPLLQWLQDRGISKATIDRNQVQMEQRYCGALKAFTDHIAFPYHRDGVVVNVKYRAPPKYFTQVKGGEQIFYGYDDAQGADEIIIVEGEMDKLAVEEALMQAATAAAAGAEGGSAQAASAPTYPSYMTSTEGVRRAVVSVPAGAPSRAGSATSSQERKFKFVDDCRSLLTAAKRVVLAVDTDGPGLALAAELVRRVGPEKCLTVRWPRKDANEVLLEDGPQVLKACLDAAEPVPIRGLFHFDAFRKEVWLLYTQGIKGLGMGFTTGWESVDKHYKVVPGELTIVTGLSNSGKSEWLDALTVNLAQRHSWQIAICSLENTPVEHGRKLMEKYLEKAFFDVESAHAVPKMTYNDVLDGIFWLDEHFHLILPPPDEMPSIDYILEKARAAVLRYGVQGLVIDPYNELDTRRRGDMFETEYVSCMLSKIKRFAQHYECHVWFVAHPRTQRGVGVGGGSSTLSAPSMYDISGSAHFINKADNGIVIHRPYTNAAAVAEGKDISAVQILVRKVRNKVAGSIGDVMLTYDRATGRYEDVKS